MDISSLNLARKWRSKTFDEIIGQDLAVKMLKNSLFLGHYFPVYLFAGQKGCGKTSTARVFAMAINCESLSSFQRDPRQHQIPCSMCPSCKAMLQGKHPDFIEIDAASNTGVDNVRNIIDAAALLPLMGKKRIYLIDEAHMLSKAAFNAFLKLLEEPPATAIFMLATTDAHKIIDTVRSRCFQLSFKPVALDPLNNHLRSICVAEQIAFEEQGLVRIIQETGGCVRDALNLLEQVRFSHSRVDEDSVREVLGYLEDSRLITLYALAVNGNVKQLIASLRELCLERFSADYIWRRLTALLHAMLWVKAGQQPEQFKMYVQELKELAYMQSWQKLCAASSLVFEQELVFLKTAMPHIFIETTLIRLACYDEWGQKSALASIATDRQGVESATQEGGLRSVNMAKISQENLHDTAHKNPANDARDTVDNEIAKKWRQFLAAIDQLGDPLLHSVFMQGAFISYESEKEIITIEFPEKLIFFKENVELASSAWLPLLKKNFSLPVTLVYRFVGMGQHDGAVTREEKKKTVIEPMTTKQKKALDITDAQKWRKTHLLLRYFPGIVREIHES